jgi:hypothetical protein
MKAMLALEIFCYGDKKRWELWSRIGDMVMPGLGTTMFGGFPQEVWVAEILGPDPVYGLARRFVRGFEDLSDANSKLSRGVVERYILESGRIYEVSEQMSEAEG